jgi:hypothetical protein
MKWAESESDEEVARFAQIRFRRDKPIPASKQGIQEEVKLAHHNEGLTPEDEVLLKSMGIGECDLTNPAFYES